MSFSLSKISSKLLFLGILSAVFLLIPKQTFASTTSVLLPTSDGNYKQWTPKSGSTHYTMVDESSCNGTTDYNSETTVGQRDSYGVDISSIPNGSTITGISITPCASKNSSGGSNTTFNVFYRLNGVDSADMPGYMLTTTTPSVLSATNYTGLSVSKMGTTSLEVGGVYTAGNKGVRLSQIATVITYSLPPTVTTNSATGIAQTTAIMNSTVNPNGLSTTANYRYGTSNVGCSSLPTITTDTNIGSGTSVVSNPQAIASLSANTTYYFCATATNSDGTTFGNVSSFTTIPNAPTVTTSSATSVSTSTATLNATINPNGSSTTVSYRYGISNVGCSSLSNSTNSFGIGSGSSNVSPNAQAIASLSAGTTYYFCAVASNSGGTSYGNVLSFTTSTNAPLIMVGGSGNLTSTTASVSAFINPNGSSTNRYYRYDTSNVGCSSLVNTTSSVNIGSGTTYVYPNLETFVGLSPNTTYYYCAVATNAGGTTYSGLLSFTTLP